MKFIRIQYKNVYTSLLFTIFIYKQRKHISDFSIWKKLCSNLSLFSVCYMLLEILFDNVRLLLF